MLVLPKWQTMWLESQHCSKSIINIHMPSQQTQKVLDDLRTSCCSPNKAVQLEALKCWRIWINNQSPDNWKMNTVCFTAVRPLISKKLQPLYKDVDICKIKLSLMWALLVKVQNIMHLEGPQYILEVFLQSCLSWLFSTNGDGCENEVSILILQLISPSTPSLLFLCIKTIGLNSEFISHCFDSMDSAFMNKTVPSNFRILKNFFVHKLLLLGIFKKSETLSGCDKEMFPPLSTDILLSNKVFHHFADKFLNIFIHWRKVRDKNVILKLWKHFLEYCELSCEHIPIPVWHKIFKLAGQICLEKNESVRERLNFLHSCATTLKSALLSSKFIDFGNLLTTPCEALFKKLVELCTLESNDCCDTEMFNHSKEICQVLSDRSVSVGGFDLCISVMDVLEEFCLKSLFWGVWCGLVYCYRVHLLNIDKNHFTKIQAKFYRKLRGVAVNFELDRNDLHEDCVAEVEKNINILNISCLCTFRSKAESTKTKDCSRKVKTFEVMNRNTKNQPLPHPLSNKDVPSLICGQFLTVSVYKKSKLPTKTHNLRFDLIKNILNKVGVNSAQLLFNGFFSVQFINLKNIPLNAMTLPPSNKLSVWLKTGVEEKSFRSLTISCIKAEPPPTVYSLNKKNLVAVCEKDSDEEIISTPQTRSRKRAEEEEKRKEMENQRRRKRKSFEVLVQEIVRKNKERKTEKNSSGRRSPVLLRGRQNKKKTKKKSDKVAKKTSEKNYGNKHNKNKNVEVCVRKLRNSKKEEPINQNKKEKKSLKTDGKLENYFRVITKKSGSEVKKEEKKPKKGKKTKGKTRESCCNLEKDEGEKKGEIAWKQTSLKTMMNEKSKAEKVKHGLRSRNKVTEIADEKPSTKRDNKKVTYSPLAKLSPFKEVFHDHEYAKIELQELQTLERVLLTKKEKSYEEQELKKYKKSNNELDVRNLEVREKKTENELCTELRILEPEETKKCAVEIEAATHTTAENLKLQEEQKKVTESPETKLLHALSFEKVKDGFIITSEDSVLNYKTPDLHSTNNDVSLQETSEEFKEMSTPTRKTKKRVKMLDSIKPSKKIKLDEEEKLPLEITEKENLEEKQTEVHCLTKKDKSGGLVKNDEPLKGMITSRALRMIALVPESTKSSQMQRESPSRGELLKCKKGPNVDKNSRASKMLALLSENVTEVEEVKEFKVEEVNSYKEPVTTPNMKTPVSSLKSPNSVKKRRSIRFDDAKNETVLYQTDTPPSQILEEKEKCRRIKPNEVLLTLS